MAHDTSWRVKGNREQQFTSYRRRRFNQNEGVHAKQPSTLQVHFITDIKAREIIDSRGNPTVEADVFSGKFFGRGVAPSGASTGMFEAKELRDGDKKRYLGKGVLNAVANVNGKIKRALVGHGLDLLQCDKAMIALDGTDGKSNLGGNAMIAVSLGVLRCAAAAKGKEVFQFLGGKTLPVPMSNVINGGKHAGNGLAIQEFMVVPSGIGEFRERVRALCEIYHVLGAALAKKFGAAAKNVGDEGGYAPSIGKCPQALDVLAASIEEAGYGRKVGIALDAAASSFYQESSGKYAIDGKAMGEGELLDYYLGLIKTYKIMSIEDPFFEEQFDAYAELLAKSKNAGVQIVGDDLTVTNVSRIRTAITKKSMNALLLKVNQIGTVTEALAAAGLVKRNGMNVVVSHRSGETADDTIADLAVGINAKYIKTGAPARGERTAKYNRLLRIEEMLE